MLPTNAKLKSQGGSDCFGGSVSPKEAPPAIFKKSTLCLPAGEPGRSRAGVTGTSGGRRVTFLGTFFWLPPDPALAEAAWAHPDWSTVRRTKTKKTGVFITTPILTEAGRRARDARRARDGYESIPESTS